MVIVIKMTNCDECNKKLGIFEGYRHPTLGKKYFLCSPCYDQVSESVKKWGNFVVSNSFNTESSKNNLRLNWGMIATRFNQIERMNPNVFNILNNEMISNKKRQMNIKNLLVNINCIN
jgi:hypothetical protein